VLPIEEERILNTDAVKWTTILSQSKLSADHEHYFEKEIASSAPFTHVRLTILPDGGVSRMRLWGRKA
jgi:allantoicase